MVDNTVLNVGTGVDTIASDDIAGVKHQRVKLSLGADGTAADAPVGGGVEAGSLRVTLASDSTGVLSVDDNASTLSVDDGAGSLTVDNAGTFAVQATLAAETTKVIGTVNVAAAQTLETVTTVSAVTAITNALPAGDNNIGNIDVLSVVPGTAATSLGKAEDAAHTSGDVGVMALGVRRDADTTLAATDGDYVPLQCNASGSLKVAITAGAGSGGTSIADGASFTRDTTSLTPVGGVVEASAPTVVAGDAVALSLTTAGAVRVAVASGGIAGVIEDAASAGGEEGVLAMAVRQDTLASSTSADGDFTYLKTNANGALHVTGGGGGTQYAEDAAHVSADTGTLALAVRRDTAAVGSGTDGDYSTLNVDSTGRLHVNVGNTVTVGSHAVTNAGTFATQVDGAALTALQLIDNPIVVDDAAFTPASSSVNMAGFQADETATDSIDEGDAGAARMTLDRKQIVVLQPHTQGGLSIFRSLDIDETEEDVKTSAGQLYFIHAMNMVATARYLKFYNATAANVTVGTTTPVLTFPLPANSTTGAGFTVSIPHGLEFSTAISVACTTGVADADTGAPGANDVIINLGYK